MQAFGQETNENTKINKINPKKPNIKFQYFNGFFGPTSINLILFS